MSIDAALSRTAMLAVVASASRSDERVRASRIHRLIPALCLALVFAGLSQTAIASARDWVVVDPAELGYDKAALDDAVAGLGEMRGVQGVLVARRGVLVAEHYWRGGARDVPHNLKSASKSVLSALVGIAVAQGRFGLDDAVVDLLPRLRNVDDPAKRRITVRHLLEMTSGLPPSSYQAYDVWVTRPDWVAAAFDGPMQSEPGSRYAYSTASTHLLSAIIARTTRQSTRAFAQKYLFGPMGVRIHEWPTDPQGIHVGGNNLWLKPRDVARFGQLYLDRGHWRGRTVVPAEWAAESVRSQDKTKHAAYGGYAQLWWTPFADGTFAAVGYGGQYVVVSPRDDSVIVVLSTLESKGDHWEQSLFARLRDGLRPSLVRRALPLAGRTTAGVNLRAAAGLDGRVVRVIGAGQRVERLGQDGDWLRVRVGHRVGWIHEDYVAVEQLPEHSAPAHTPIAVAPAADVSRDDGPATATVAVSEHRLDQLKEQVDALNELVNAPPPLPRYRVARVVNFRRSPNLQGEKIGRLKPGAEFQAQERSESWLMTEIDGELGWVHSDFTKALGPRSSLRRQQRLQTEIGALASAIDALERPLDGLPQQPGKTALLRAAQLGLAEAERELEKLGTEKQQLQLDVDKGLEAMETLRQENQAMADELTALRDRDRQREARVESDHLQLTELEGEVTDAVRELQRFADETTRLKEQNAELMTALDDSKSLGGELQQRLDSFLAKEAKHADAVAAAEQLAADAQDIEAVLRRRLRQAGARADDTEGAMAALRVEHDELLARYEALRETGDTQTRLVAELRAREIRRDEELTASVARIDELEVKRSELESVADEQRQALASTRDTLAQRDAELIEAAEANAGLRDENTKLHDDHAALQHTVDAMSIELTGLAEQLRDAVDERDEHGRSWLSAWTAHTIAVSDNAAMAQDFADASARLRAADEQARRGEQQLRAAESRVAELEHEIARLETEKTALRTDVSTAGQALATLRIDAADAKQQAQQQSARADALESELSELGDEFEVVSAKHVELVSTLADAEQQAQQQSARADVLESELSELGEEFEVVSAKRVELMSTLADAQQELEARAKRVVDLEQEGAGIVRDLEETKQRYQAAEQTAQQANELVASLRDGLEQATEARGLLQEENDRLSAQLGGARDLSSSLKKREREQVARTEELETIVSRRVEEIAQLRETVASMQAAATAHADSLSASESSLKETRAALSVEQGQRAALEERVSGLRTELAARTAEATALRAVDKRLHVALAEVAELQRVADAHEQNGRNLIARLEQLQAIDARRQRRISALEGENRAHGVALVAAKSELRELSTLAQAVRLAEQSAEGAETSDEGPAVLHKRAVTFTAPAVTVAAAVEPELEAARPFDNSEIESFVRDWAAAWSRQDVPAYLSYYSAEFRPESGLSRKSWERQRRLRVRKPRVIDVQVSDVQVTRDDERLSVSFQQAYRANHYRDRVAKTLELRADDGAWKIVREISR